MRQKLTHLSIESLPHPPTGSQKYWDTVQTGFGIRCTSRSKSYFVVFGKRRQLHTIGKFEAISLSNARKEARRYLDRDEPQKRLERLLEAREAYISECESRLRPATVLMYRYYLNQGTKTYLKDITSADIDVGHPQTVATWKAFYNWCIRQSLVDKNPFLGLSAKTNERERILTTDELSALWSLDDTMQSRTRVLILTGLRRGELNNMAVGDTLKITETKNHTTHELPLTPLLKPLVPLPYFNGWSRAKVRVDAKLGFPQWTWHDIRRTFATIHAQIGTPIHVVEALLNHQSGTISGIARIYIRHNFLAEAHTAQLAYEDHLRYIVSA